MIINHFKSLSTMNRDLMNEQTAHSFRNMINSLNSLVDIDRLKQSVVEFLQHKNAHNPHHTVLEGNQQSFLIDSLYKEYLNMTLVLPMSRESFEIYINSNQLVLIEFIRRLVLNYMDKRDAIVETPGTPYYGWDDIHITSSRLCFFTGGYLGDSNLTRNESNGYSAVAVNLTTPSSLSIVFKQFDNMSSGDLMTLRGDSTTTVIRKISESQPTVKCIHSIQGNLDIEFVIAGTSIQALGIVFDTSGTVYRWIANGEFIYGSSPFILPDKIYELEINQTLQNNSGMSIDSIALTNTRLEVNQHLQIM